MPHPMLIPIGFRLLIVVAGVVAGALGLSLAKAANRSNQEDTEKK